MIGVPGSVARPYFAETASTRSSAVSPSVLSWAKVREADIATQPMDMTTMRALVIWQSSRTTMSIDRGGTSARSSHRPRCGLARCNHHALVTAGGGSELRRRIQYIPAPMPLPGFAPLLFLLGICEMD